MATTGRDVDAAQIDLRDEARAALDLVGADPRAALARADAVVAAIPRQRASRDQREALSIAHRAAGIALFQLPDVRAAEARLRRAVRIAESAGEQTPAAEATMSLAFVLLQRGRATAALTAIDRARPRLTGVAAARLEAQRAYVLQELGRPDEALECYARSLLVLRASGDTLWQAQVHNNRSQLYAYRGDLVAARADLRRAADIFAEASMPMRQAHILSDLGWLEGMAGRIPEALRLMDEADEILPDYDPVAALDRADILMRAGLSAEAVATATTAVTWLVRGGSGWGWLSANAELQLAQALLAAGRSEEAATHASTAARMFGSQGRRSWRVLAEYARQRALLELSEPVVLRSMLTAIRLLETHGWSAHALDLRVVSAERARSAGRAPLARTLLGTPVYSASARLDVRSRVRHAQAILALLDGDEPAFRRALTGAWTISEAQRGLVGATELRAMVAGHALDIVELGLAHGLRAGSPAITLTWAERGRASALRFPPPLPSRSDDLADALGALRVAAKGDDDARLEGRRDDTASTRRARVEQRVVRLSRQASGVQDSLAPVSVSQIHDVAEGHVLVEYVVAAGDLAAILIGAGRPRLVGLGPVDAVGADIARLEFTMRRLATGFGLRGAAPSTAESALPRLREAARAVDARLLGPLARALGDASLVVSPTGPLWHVPWSALPSLAGRPVSIAPSATVWHRAAGRPRPSRSRVLTVAGPRLDAAADEARAVAELHGGATLLVEGAATVSAVSVAMGTHDIAHLAVHGTLRSDNPLFSSLALTDGPLTGYDLERLGPLAHTVVLPACHSGEGRALVGDEMLGLAWTLLGAGTSSVIAATTAVADEATSRLMRRLHHRLAQGRSAASALAMAQSESPTDDPLDVATAASFVCAGA